jgi:hypothetical protein
MVDLQVRSYEMAAKHTDRAIGGQDPEAKARRAQRLAQGAARRHAVVWDETEHLYIGRWS